MLNLGKIKAAIVPRSPGSAALTYEEVLEHIKDVEGQVVGAKLSPYPLLASLQRTATMPPLLMGKGLKAKFHWWGPWMALTTALLVLGGFLSVSQSDVDPIIKQGLAWVWMVVPVFLVLFPMPSNYAASNVSKEDIAFAVENLGLRGLATAQRLPKVMQVLKVVEARCSSRLQTLKWIVGTAWAIWIFVLLKGTELVLGGKAPTAADFFGLATVFYVAMGIYIMAASYETGLNRVFRTVEIACNEVQPPSETTHTASPDARSSRRMRPSRGAPYSPIRRRTPHGRRQM